MEELERHEKCIMDNHQSIVIDLVTNTVYFFNFEEMTVSTSDSHVIKPIRYFDNVKKVRIWGNSSWIRFNNIDVTAAITKLFDNYNERILLGIVPVMYERVYDDDDDDDWDEQCSEVDIPF